MRCGEARPVSIYRAAGRPRRTSTTSSRSLQPWRSPARSADRRQDRARGGRATERQRDRERRPLAVARRDRDAPAHLLDQLPADVQAETRAADTARHARIEAIELLEDPLLLPRRDPKAAVGDLDHTGCAVRIGAHLDAAAGR